MSSTEQRALLQTQENPNKVMDYITTLETLSTDGKTRISLRYVPDRLILTAPSFQTYCDTLLTNKDCTLEQSASQLLDDINNELVARWVQIIAFADHSKSTQQAVVLEDKQPQWENPYLMDRLGKI